MSAVQVAFRYGDRRLLARLITAWAGGDSAHCEVSVNRVLSSHLCVSSSWVDGGVRAKVIELAPEKWRIYELDAAVDPLLWVVEHRSAPYDYLGLLGFVIRRVSGRSGRYFCSEAAATIIGLSDPWRYDLALLESVCRRYGRRIQ